MPDFQLRDEARLKDFLLFGASKILPAQTVRRDVPGSALTLRIATTSSASLEPEDGKNLSVNPTRIESKSSELAHP